jgi:hypothetical protein
MLKKEEGGGRLQQLMGSAIFLPDTHEMAQLVNATDFCFLEKTNKNKHMSTTYRKQSRLLGRGCRKAF